MLDEDVGDPEQPGAAGEEEPAVQGGQAQADGASGQVGSHGQCGEPALNAVEHGQIR
jgi:hypothetical protein